MSDVTLHKKAEWVLRNAHDDLERRVVEGTAELVQANVGLENLKTQLLDTNGALSTFAQNIERQREEIEKYPQETEDKQRATQFEEFP